MDFLSFFSDIESFIVDYSDGDIEPFTKGGFSKVFSYRNKIYIVQKYSKDIELIYDKLEQLGNKKHVLMPTERSYVLKDKNNEDEELVLEFETCNGDLFLGQNDKSSENALKIIRENSDKYKEQFREIVQTVKSIHKMGIRTMDIKPANMLYCEGSVIKMTDFGGSMYLQNGEWKGEGSGTLGYAAGSWESGKYLTPYQEDLFALYLSFIEILEPLENNFMDRIRKGKERILSMMKKAKSSMVKQFLQEMLKIPEYKVNSNPKMPPRRRNSRRISLSQLNLKF